MGESNRLLGYDNRLLRTGLQLQLPSATLSCWVFRSAMARAAAARLLSEVGLALGCSPSLSLKAPLQEAAWESPAFPAESGWAVAAALLPDASLCARLLSEAAALLLDANLCARLLSAAQGARAALGCAAELLLRERLEDALWEPATFPVESGETAAIVLLSGNQIAPDLF